MATGYKVRIGDGSEIGPMDLAAVRSWYSQGLLDKNSPVLRPGANRWSTLGQVADLKGLVPATPRARRNGGGASAAARPRSAPGRDITIDVPDPGRWRTQAAGAILVLIAAGLAFFAFRPYDVGVGLETAPWTEIALLFLALGLALAAGWEAGRKVVRVAVFVLAFLLFPVAGVLVAQGVRGVALLALFGAWVSLFGFFALLGGESISWARAGTAFLVVLAGGIAFGYFAYRPETTERRQIREWAAPERQFADASLGVSMALPRGWTLLRAGSPVPGAPSDARALLAQPRLLGFAYVTAESSPSGIASLNEYLDRAWSLRLRSHPGLKQTSRSELKVADQPATRLTGSWDAEGTRFQETATVWRDGWVYFSLVAWLPEGAPRRDLETDALVAGVATQGELATRLQTALVNIAMEVPQLTPAAAEMLMASSEAKVLEPEQAFRRALEALSRAVPALGKKDLQALTQITTATYGALVPRERDRLAAYVARVREQKATSAAEDKEASLLMKAVLLRLPAERRRELQELYAQAIKVSFAKR